MQGAEQHTSHRKDTRPLTRKQQLFVQEYLVDLNGAGAAVRAGYSERTANRMAAENLTKPVIAQAVQKAFAERSKRTEITQDRVIQEYARIAFSDISDYVDWDNDGVRLKDSAVLDEYMRRAVSEVSQTVTKDGGTVRFKLHDKVGALDALGKHLGMFPREVKHSGVIEHILPPKSGLTVDELRELRDSLKELKERESIEGQYRELPSGEAADD